MTTPRISEAEWEVMQVLWDRNPATAADLIETLRSRRTWSDRTVKSLLSRLVKKGALAFEQEGNRYLYRPTASRAEMVREESRTFLERVFGGAASPLLVHFLKQENLSSEELGELRALVDELENQQRGDER